MRRYLAFALIGLGVAVLAHAQDAVDASTDAEEAVADSDAATTLAIAAEKRARQEREENARLTREANKARYAADVKRQEAGAERLRVEAEIENLVAEQRKIKAELVRIQIDTQKSEQAIRNDQARAEKLRQATDGLEQQRASHAQNLTDLMITKEQLEAQVKAAEQEKSQAETDLAKAQADEAQAAKTLEQTKANETREQVRLQAQIAALKERYRQARNHARELASESDHLKQNTAKLEQQAKVGEEEVGRAEAK